MGTEVELQRMTKPIIMVAPPTLTDNQLACVDLLSEALEQARAGNISSVGIIACMKTGYATVMAGNQPGDLNMGCDSLKKKILEAVEHAGSKIMRVK